MAENNKDIELGSDIYEFYLQGTDNKMYSVNDVRGQNGIVVMFICNHCPYVKAILPKITRDAVLIQKLGIGAIAINSNDPKAYPEDSFEIMQKISKEHNFSFPYVVDPTQKIARAFNAACTPEFYGYNRFLKLQYHGRFDNSGRDSKPDAEPELLNAMTMIAETDVGPTNQFNSIGCSIKWISQ